MKRQYIIYLHTGYWLLVLIQVLLVGLGTGVLGTQIAWNLFALIVLPVKAIQVLCSVIFFYTNYFLLIPGFLKAGNIFKYLLAVVAALLIFTPVYYLLEQHIYPRMGWKSYTADMNFWFALMVTLSSNFINIFLGLLLSYLMDWRSVRDEKELMEKEQLKTELAFLKSQVNPHFLFNTINDIYSLTQQQAKEAPEALLKLSELLRYMMRESDVAFVGLAQEIAYLENVIELQQIGQKGECYIDFRIDGEITTQKIAPLILINFIENAFKHGIYTDPENPILLLITVTGNVFELNITNKINRIKKDKTGGIGLPNVKRRLALIYPDKYELAIKPGTDTFAVDLKIELI